MLKNKEIKSDKIKDIKITSDYDINKEKKKYEYLLLDFNKQIKEIKKLKENNDDLVCSSNSSEGEMNEIRNKYDEEIIRNYKKKFRD